MTAVEESGKKGPSHRLWRNGMDFVPKKTYPPDYSNVPSVRDWQMSPFGNERYDLDEIQRAEKKGFKGRVELEMIKKRLAAEKLGKKISSDEPAENEEKKLAPVRRASLRKRSKCCTDLMYQPYGPSLVSSLSYNRPYLNPPRMYSYLGPSYYSGYRFGSPCSNYGTYEAKIIKNIYMPYGPYGELRMTPDMYIPMGPSILPLNLSF